MKRRIAVFLLIAALAAALAGPALAAVDLDSPAYVVDDAGVLSDALEDQIIQTNQTLEYDCSGAQFVVVTVAYAPAGYDQEEYAVEIFNRWSIGSQKENNGMLLVVYTENNEFWLQPGNGIWDSPYVDEIADMVKDDSRFVKNLEKGDYETAVSTLLSEITDWYTDYYGSTANNGAPHTYGGSYGGNAYEAPASQTTRSSSGSLWGLLLVVLLIVILTSPLRTHRRWGHWGIWPFFYFSPWWATRRRVTRPVAPPPPRAPWEQGYSSRSGVYRNYGSRPSSGFGSRPSSGFSSRPSSGSSFRSGGGSSSRGGFGSGGSSFRSGGSSFHGGGGHASHGGFGKR